MPLPPPTVALSRARSFFSIRRPPRLFPSMARSRTMRTPTRHTVRTVQVLCVTVTAALVATGCGRSADSGPGTGAPAKLGSGKAAGKVVMWSMGDPDKSLQSLAKKFEEQNPGAKVQITPVPWASAHDKLTTAIAGGNTPDMSVI